jgi:thiamine biosynthesis lipoprotein
VSPGAGQVGSGQVGTCSAGHRTAPRTVRHVMNLPVSLALRGRHAADEQGRAALAQAMAELRGRRGVQHLPAGLLRLPARPGRGHAGVLPTRGGRGAGPLGSWPSGSPRGAFQVRRAGPDGEVVLDPTGVVKGWAVERAADHLVVWSDGSITLVDGPGARPGVTGGP